MNYPNGIKKNFKSSNFINYANRGMKLEDDLNITNNYYRDMDVVLYIQETHAYKNY